MQISNYYQKPGSYNDGAEDRVRQKNDIQREIIMRETDLKRKQNERINLEMEIRHLKKEDAMTKVAIHQKENEFERVVQELSRMELDIQNLKKKMNLV